MKRPLLAIAALLISASLYASGPYTLTNIKAVRLYVKNESNLLNKEDVEALRVKLATAAQTLGLKTDQRDVPTLMVKIDSMSNGAKHYVYIKLAVGEDVSTKRKGSIKTFALTYDASDFFDTETPKKSIYESVDDLTAEFISHYKEDNGL